MPLSGRTDRYWKNGQIKDLGTLPGAQSSVANAINNKGQIVGVSGSQTSPHAFLWQNGRMTDIGAFTAYAINDSGQVVGTNGTHAVLWQNGHLTDLGALPGDQGSVAYGINAAGEIVGKSTNLLIPPGAPVGNAVTIIDRAFLWKNGTMMDLNALLVVPGWTLNIAVAINDNGQIVGGGGYQSSATTPNGTAFIASPLSQ